MTAKTASTPPTTSQAPPAAQGQQASRARERLKAFHEEDALGKAYDTRLMKRLWPFVKPHGKWIAFSLVILVVLSAVDLTRPLIMGDIVAKAAAKDASSLLWDGLLLTGLLVVSQTMTFVQTYTMQIAGARAMADLRAHVFVFLQQLQLRYFDRTPVGRLVTRATNDVDAVGELFASGVLNAMGDLIKLVGIVIMMVSLDVRLSLITFALMPIVGFVVNWVRKRSR